MFSCPGERLIGTLTLGRYDGTEREHHVMLWPNYGVVIPTLITTRGSAIVAGTFIAHHVAWRNHWRPVNPVPTDNHGGAILFHLALQAEITRIGKGHQRY